MFIVVDFGKRFSKLRVLDTTDNITEEIDVSTLASARANGIELYPMYLRMVDVKSVQHGNGYLIEKRNDGKRLVIPSSILEQYVHSGFAVIAK